ncbi:MAG: translation elongation factor Ts [Clostridiales bacterium]|jgi:elongation factor Ts|nr:translation elongation factor Ts [Clostridiales bacterium]
MAVTAALVKELRELSGAGMVDCKNALTEADGNIEKAIELLREKGMAAAVKKAGRIASEGLCQAYIDESGKTAVVVEVNSETDFVAKNAEFRSFVDAVARQAAASSSKDMEGLYAEKYLEDPSLTLREALNGKILTIGENLNARRFERFSGDGSTTFVSYIHAGGKVAVILELAGPAGEALTEAGKNLAMQIAAMNPLFVDRESVPEEFIQKEREILTQAALNENAQSDKPKPEKVVRENIVEGRLSKELKNFCLLEQEYVKDGAMTVAAYLKSVDGTAKALRFARFETGEGLEKKGENFAEEVSKLTS